MPFKDTEKTKEYHRLRMREKRKEFFNNKKCVLCSSLEDLQLDHIDRTTKVSHKIWSWNQERKEIELKKCQVLCKKCHLIKTIKENVTKEHSYYAYKTKKCTCDICYNYYRVVCENYNKQRREKRKLRN